MKKHTTLRLVRDQSEFKLEVGRGGGGVEEKMWGPEIF